MITRTNAFIGQKFGSLIVVEILPSVKMPRKTGTPFTYAVMVKCQCKCGAMVVKKKKALNEGNGCHCGNIECKRTRMRSF